MCSDIDRVLVGHVLLVDLTFFAGRALFADLAFLAAALFAIDLSSSPSLWTRPRPSTRSGHPKLASRGERTALRVYAR
jgi:hypothetical protein